MTANLIIVSIPLALLGLAVLIDCIMKIGASSEASINEMEHIVRESLYGRVKKAEPITQKKLADMARERAQTSRPPLVGTPPRFVRRQPGEKKNQK